MSQRRRKLALRESILDAARSIVREEGLRALTMRRIGEAIDYSAASLYAHFESRDMLLAELCREGFTALRVALEEAVVGISDPAARLRELSAAYLRFAVGQPDTYRLIFMEDPALTKEMFASHEFADGAIALGLIVAPLVQLRAAGELREEADPMLIADMLWTIVHGLASLRIACPTLPASADSAVIDAAITSILDGWRPVNRAPS